MNGAEAIIELITRPKKVSIPKEDIINLDAEDDGSNFDGNKGGASNYGGKRGSGFGGG